MVVGEADGVGDGASGGTASLRAWTALNSGSGCVVGFFHGRIAFLLICAHSFLCCNGISTSRCK